MLDSIGGKTLLVIMTARVLALSRRAPHSRRRAAGLRPAQCRHGDARGLEVSPSSLLQNELIRRRIADGLTQPDVLELGASPAQSSVHGSPSATDNASPRSRRFGGLRPPWITPGDQNVNLPQRDDLFRLVCFLAIRVLLDIKK